MARIVKVKEVAEFLRLSEVTVCKLLAEGKLPGFKIGDSWRLDMDEILEHIEKAKVVSKQGKAGKTGRGAAKQGKGMKQRISAEKIPAVAHPCSSN